MPAPVRKENKKKSSIRDPLVAIDGRASVPRPSAGCQRHQKRRGGPHTLTHTHTLRVLGSASRRGERARFSSGLSWTRQRALAGGPDRAVTPAGENSGQDSVLLGTREFPRHWTGTTSVACFFSFSFSFLIPTLLGAEPACRSARGAQPSFSLAATRHDRAGEASSQPRFDLPSGRQMERW